MAMTRRDLIALFCCSLLLSLAPQPGGIAALAKDDDDDDDGGSHGGGGHGNDDDGDDDDDDEDEDDDDDEDLGADGAGGARRSDQERARDGVEKGDILPLKEVLRLVDEDRYGRVIAVDLKRSGGSEIYRLRTRDRQGTIRNLRINARTGKFVNIFGF
ncbi:PepSY domain-containing protein [Ensifer sp. LBL]|uniref:PepSY domain-containing protein n=1 Tax=Ensifer sp. LBL TaxID=2991056 RepID=UPI003D1A4A85